MKHCIGIRQENAYPNEQRAPLTPDHVRKLIRDHRLRVIVTPSSKRCFADREYQEAGAEISPDLSPCAAVFGVKEIPPDDVLPKQAYYIFSHTMAGHSSTMPMLQRIVEKQSSLIDYELIKSSRGRRLIFFGHFAGYAGMIDGFWALGQRLAWEGIDTVFSEIRPAYEYDSLAAAQAELKRIGASIRREGLPRSLVPLVLGFTGRGNVARGAQRIAHLLPAVKLVADDLRPFFRAGRFSNGTLYTVQFRQRDLFEPQDRNLEFDWSRLHRRPETFRNRFEEFVPYLSVLINGIHWESRYPRLVTKSCLKSLYEHNPNPRLRVIADITCDVGGSIEATVKTSPSGEGAAYVYEPSRDQTKSGVGGIGPVILAIDTLPSELPREASESFGHALAAFVPAMAAAEYQTGNSEDLTLPEEIRNAMIVHNGELTRNYRYLADYLQRSG